MFFFLFCFVCMKERLEKLGVWACICKFVCVCTVCHQLGGPHGWLVSDSLHHKSESSAGPGRV